MNPTPKNDTGRILGAIWGGFLGVLLAAFAISIPVYFIFGVLFPFDIFNVTWKGEVGIVFYMFICLVWLFISMMCGGYVAARIAIQNEYQITWIIICMGLVAYIINRLSDFYFSDVIFGLVLFFTGSTGAVAGCHSGIQYKERKKKI